MFGANAKEQCRGLQAALTAISRSQAMIEFAPDGTIIDANENTLRMMGYRLDEIKGRHHSMFLPPAKRDSAEYHRFWADLQRGEFRDGVFRFLAKGDREVWLQATFNPVLDAAGRTAKVITVAADVTQARLEHTDLSGQAQAIRRSQAVIEFNVDGTILTANENFLRTMGYTLAEITGQHHRLFVPAAERDSLAYRDFWTTLGRGEYRAGEFKRIAKGGREVWLQATYNPIFDSDGKPVKVIKFATDVTAARAESVNNKGQIQAIHHSQAVIEFSLDSTILTANENFLRATGYSLAELVGQKHAMLVDPVERASAAYRDFWAALARGEYRAAEFRRIKKGGGELWLRATYNPIYDLNGKPFKVVKFATDVTAQAIARGQFNQLIDTVVTALSAIKQAIDSVSQFVTSTTAAVEEQSAVTETISANMQTAAERAGSLWAA
jgi:methyl-accepting chemotaxis protein